MKMAVFWVVASCILVEVYRRFQRYLPPPSSGRHDVYWNGEVVIFETDIFCLEFNEWFINLAHAIEKWAPCLCVVARPDIDFGGDRQPQDMQGSCEYAEYAAL
jgi:hypothetical protein